MKEMATEKDIGHLCFFRKFLECELGWNEEQYGILSYIEDNKLDGPPYYIDEDGFSFEVCYPLSKTDVERLTGFKVVDNEPITLNGKVYCKLENHIHMESLDE